MIPRDVFHRTEQSFDPERVVDDFVRIANEHELSPTKRQLCLTSREGSADPLRDGVGTAKFSEEDYSVFNPEFAGTVFEEFYRTSPYRLGRVRIMLLPARTTYSFHADKETRLHMALSTNDEAFLLFSAGHSRFHRVHVPANGCVYWTDTRREHTAMNTGKASRVHLVATIIGQK